MKNVTEAHQRLASVLDAQKALQDERAEILARHKEQSEHHTQMMAATMPGDGPAFEALLKLDLQIRLQPNELAVIDGKLAAAVDAIRAPFVQMQADLDRRYRAVVDVLMGCIEKVLSPFTEEQDRKKAAWAALQHCAVYRRLTKAFPEPMARLGAAGSCILDPKTLLDASEAMAHIEASAQV